MNKSLFRFIPLRIHVWGGFGSQLYALLLYRSIKREHQFRNPKIIFHSAGVTMRRPEVLDSLGKINHRIIDDFRAPAHKVPSFIGAKGPNFAHRLINMIGIMDSREHDNFSMLHPWTISLRGSYTKIPLLSEDLTWLTNHLDLSPEHSICCGHFRMGDLLEKKPSSFISFSTFTRILKTSSNDIDNPFFRIHTDSPEYVNEALNLVGDSYLEPTSYLVCGLNFKSLETVSFCVSGASFVGTNSKLSVWICLLRIHLGKQNNYLPSSLKALFLSSAPNGFERSIFFYD